MKHPSRGVSELRHHFVDPRLAFLCGIVPAMAFISRYWPYFMPFEGIFTTETLNHSLHRLVLRRFSFSVLPRHGLHGVYAPLCHRVITSRCGCVFGLAVGVHRQYALQVTWIRILPGRSARNFTCKHARGTLNLHRKGRADRASAPVGLTLRACNQHFINSSPFRTQEFTAWA